MVIISSSITNASNVYDDQIEKASNKYSVDKALIKAVIKRESAFNPNAVSPVGAQGLMQLMPATATDLGVTDPFNPTQNINAGSKYLAWLSSNAWGSPCLILASYNWGIGNVQKLVKKKKTRDCKKLLYFMPSETQTYVKKVYEYSNDFGTDLGVFDIQASGASEDIANYGGGFFKNLFKTFNDYLNLNFIGKVDQTIALVDNIFSVLISIYLLVTIVDFVAGKPPSFTNIIKSAFFIKLSLSIILYKQFIVDGLTKIDTYFIGLFVSGYNPPDSLDIFLSHVVEALAYAHTNGSMTDVFFTWLLVLDFVSFATIYSTILLLIDLIIALCVFVAPLFFIISIYKSTKRMLKMWFQIIISCLVAKVLLATIFSLTFNTALEQMLTMNFDSLIDYIAPEIIMFITMGLFLQVPSVASSLTGGFEVSIKNKVFLLGNSTVKTSVSKTIEISKRNRQLRKQAKRNLRIQKHRDRLK